MHSLVTAHTGIHQPNALMWSDGDSGIMIRPVEGTTSSSAACCRAVDLKAVPQSLLLVEIHEVDMKNRTNYFLTKDFMFAAECLLFFK